MGERMPLSESFWQRVDQRGPDDCWHWLGSVDSTGYGVYGAKQAPSRAAHRLAYLLAAGPISDELTLDHLCHTRDRGCPGSVACTHRRCVNPAHLEPVTRGENTRRGGWSRRTHCRNGHPYDETNTYHAAGARHCRACRANTERRRRSGVSKQPTTNGQKTHCLRGHPLSGDNVKVGGRGERICRICARERSRALYQRRKVDRSDQPCGSETG